jgi:tubulin-folding cofactor B
MSHPQPIVARQTAFSSNAIMADVPLMVVSENASSERRITPSWTITQLRAKLEPITGIPPSCQKLAIQVPGSPPVAIEAADEDSTHLSSFPLRAYAELSVSMVP